MNHKTSFSTRLSLNILVVASLLFIGAIAVAAISSHDLISREATKSTENLLDAAISEIEKTLESAESSVMSTKWLVPEHLDDREYLYHISSRIVEENDHIAGSAIAFVPNYFDGMYYFSPYSYVDVESGEVKSKQLGNPSYDYFYMDWFQIPYLLGEPCWSEPYFDDGGGSLLMSTYSYPLKDEKGNVYAIVTADISLDWISEIVAQIHPYPNSYVTLVSRCGSYINVGEDSRLSGETIYSTLHLQKIRNPQLDNVAATVMNEEKGTLKYHSGPKTAFTVFGTLSNGWKAALTCDSREVLSRTTQMQLILILIGLIGLNLLAIFCHMSIRKVTKPLSDFSQSALSIAEGDFNAPLPEIKSEDEIRQLRDSFECMQKSLTEYIDDLKATTAANERFESELNIASAIQMNMLPHDFPTNDRIELSAFLHPAREVGGDFYDFALRGDNLFFTIGDVSGKGVPASLFMAITRASFHFISGLGLELDQIVSKMNDSISEGNDAGLFVTVFAGCINLKTGDFTWCNAGHNPIVVIPPDPSEPARFLDVKPNIAIGVFPGFPYQIQRGKLQNGTRLLLYTDGVTEAEKADKNQFGEQALLDWSSSAAARSGSAASVCESLHSAVEEFAAGNDQNDDITIMAINIKKID